MKIPTDHSLHWIAIGHIDITRRPRHQQIAGLFLIVGAILPFQVWGCYN